MTDNWMKQYPSVWVNRTYIGDRKYADKYYGEGNKLLYQLKNRMRLGNLGQLKMTRRFTDGTAITAWSIFGKDFINIDVSRRLKLYNPSCRVELLDLPLVIPPMMWYASGTETFTKEGEVWVIKNPSGEIEVEGVDYIKTYYRVAVLDCPTCTPIFFTIGSNIGAINENSRYRPFYYKSENNDGSFIYTYENAMVPHYMGPPEDSMNHMIYSYYESGQAEIIKSDTDGGGTYILWRAYTEWSNAGPDAVDFSRTGLGYMLMQGFVRNTGINLCETDPTIIKVDCCEKLLEDRPVEIWWEGIAGSCTGFGEWFMNYGGVDICKMPTSLSASDLFFYTSVHPEQPFYSIPEIKGSCLPIEWTLSGSLNFEPPSDKDDYTIYTTWDTVSVDCHDEASITLKDRCGTEYNVTGVPCCGNTEELEIQYTSLFMSCGEVQQFLTTGGCSPIEWSVSGGGSITQSGLYTSPVNNPDCGNPVVTVTDCCGTTASITLGVSCYDVTGHVAINDKSGQMTLPCVWDSGSGYWKSEMRIIWRYYDCTGQAWIHGTDPVCCVPTNCEGHTWVLVSGNEATCNSWLPCYGSPCITAPPCGITDVRSPADLAAGCCPINPATGFPWGYIPFAWE